jgi:hypothetical protein
MHHEQADQRLPSFAYLDYMSCSADLPAVTLSRPLIRTTGVICPMISTRSAAT